MCIRDRQVTEFKEGILPWSIQNPVALVFDEYDAGRPDVMFVIQRILEAEGNFTLLDKNKVLEQHDFFRMFATTNTVGLGDTTGLYTGTQQINQAQLDRWEIVTSLNYLSSEKELEIIKAEIINSGKPSEMAEKISSGKISKFLNDNSLLNQQWVMEPKKKVNEIINELNIKDIKFINSEGEKVELSQIESEIIFEWANLECPYVKRHYGSNNMQTTQEFAKSKNVMWITVISSANGKQGYIPPKAVSYTHLTLPTSDLV